MSADLLRNAIVVPGNSLALEEVPLKAGLGGLETVLRVEFAARVPDDIDEHTSGAVIAREAIADMAAAGKFKLAQV